MVQKDAGWFGGSDDSENNCVVPTGRFKGLVQCFNEELRKGRSKLIAEGYNTLRELIKKAYDLQMSKSVTTGGKQFAFDWESIEDLAREKDAYWELKMLLNNCGLGRLRIDRFIGNFKYEKSLFERLNLNLQTKVRLYCLEGYNFAKKDLFSDSDPYLKITCGDKVYNEEENYQTDTDSPQFWTNYDFVVDFPGANILHIDAYDYDVLFGDELIGHTKIDLDDRFYNKEWASLANKPVEYRNLHHPSTTISQGVLKTWLTIHPLKSKEAESEAMDISAEPVEEFEMRLIIWKTQDIECMDFEGTSDIFVRAFIDPEDDHFTDTHWRCQDGEGSFNWRLLMPLKSQKPNYNLTIQAWDKDVIASNDLIGDFNIDLQPIFQDCLLTGRIQTLCKKYWDDYMQGAVVDGGFDKLADFEWDSKEEKEDKFWVSVRRDVAADGDKQAEPQKYAGKIQCSLRIYPKDKSEKAPQGVGRSEPNNDPVCPEPEGRLKFSLNPFEMFNQLIGPGIRRKIYMLLCTIACAALCIYMFPMIISNGISKLIYG